MTGLGCAVVYAVMRHQHSRIERAADELARRLESYHSPNQLNARFENPFLRRCRDILGCERSDCPMFSARQERCWQVMALSQTKSTDRRPNVTLQQCHDCKVYRLSCPDGLTRLGESFNNLMFLLAEEAEQVRRMHSQMLEKEKMVAIGQMAAGIAHEISNPLSSIFSIVQMLKRKPNAANTLEQFDLMHKHIQRISGTVRQLASLSRPAPERWELVDLAPTLEEAVKLVSFDHRARGITIRLDKPAALPATYALRNQMQQVFINLLLNALDAMPDGGQLVVNVEHTPRRIAFHFDDSGHGIPPEIGRRVFEPFFTTKEPGRGTGLGLSVSYSIVQKHSGEIDFASRPEGGTRFTVTVPVATSAPED
jgi:signal transduction histidine kinase